MAILPVLVDFWTSSADPGSTINQIWDALVQDYMNMAEITDHTIRQALDSGSTLTYIKDTANQKIMLRYDPR